MALPAIGGSEDGAVGGLQEVVAERRCCVVVDDGFHRPPLVGKAGSGEQRMESVERRAGSGEQRTERVSGAGEWAIAIRTKAHVLEQPRASF